MYVYISVHMHLTILVNPNMNIPYVVTLRSFRPHHFFTFHLSGEIICFLGSRCRKNFWCTQWTLLLQHMSADVFAAIVLAVVVLGGGGGGKVRRRSRRRRSDEEEEEEEEENEEIGRDWGLGGGPGCRGGRGTRRARV